jgi:hypothetical protein
MNHLLPAFAPAKFVDGAKVGVDSRSAIFLTVAHILLTITDFISAVYTRANRSTFNKPCFVTGIAN